MTKTDSTFPAFSLRIVDFAAQFLLRCKFSFHEKRHWSQVCQWRDLPKAITILCQRTATNGIASFCIDHRWRQTVFLRDFQNGERPIFARLTWNKAAFMRTKLNSLLYKTNRFHVVVHLSSNRSQRTSKCDYRYDNRYKLNSFSCNCPIASCATFLFLPHFDVICDLLLDRCTATWNLFVKYA